MKVEHEKTNEILKWFEEITKIPRCSKNEDAICKWLFNWAKDKKFDVETDRVNNVLIKIPYLFLCFTFIKNQHDWFMGFLEWYFVEHKT